MLLICTYMNSENICKQNNMIICLKMLNIKGYKILNQQEYDSIYKNYASKIYKL